MFSSKCETFAFQVAYTWVAELIGVAHDHVKKTRIFL